jgi:hypothetical protein
MPQFGGNGGVRAPNATLLKLILLFVLVIGVA